LVAHDILTILVLQRGELLEDLLRSTEESDLVLLGSLVVILLGWLGSKGHFGVVEIKV